jgi:hypothetical protein
MALDLSFARAPQADLADLAIANGKNEPVSHRCKAVAQASAPCRPIPGHSIEGLVLHAAEKYLAPRAGFEPATIRLTVECSTTELPGNSEAGLASAAYNKAIRACKAVNANRRRQSRIEAKPLEFNNLRRLLKVTAAASNAMPAAAPANDHGCNAKTSHSVATLAAVKPNTSESMR